MSEKKEERHQGPLEGRVAVAPPVPSPQQQQRASGPIVGGLQTGGEGDEAMKSKETIPGGLYVNDSGYYVNASRKFVDRTGKEVDQNKPVKAKRGETPVQDHQAAQQRNVLDQPDEDEA